MDRAAFPQRRRSTVPDFLESATLGDVLHHLAFLSPDDIQAIDKLARAVFAERWQERFYPVQHGGVITH